jgi:hypothetical protein
MLVYNAVRMQVIKWKIFREEEGERRRDVVHARQRSGGQGARCGADMYGKHAASAGNESGRAQHAQEQHSAQLLHVSGGVRAVSGSGRAAVTEGVAHAK